MKTLKKIIYSIVIAGFFAGIVLNILFNILVDDLREYTELHIDRNSLYDSAIMCSQLYFMNPNDVNKLTCKIFTDKIVSIDNKLEKYYFANIYLSAIK